MLQLVDALCVRRILVLYRKDKAEDEVMEGSDCRALGSIIRRTSLSPEGVGGMKYEHCGGERVFQAEGE